MKGIKLDSVGTYLRFLWILKL